MQITRTDETINIFKIHNEQNGRDDNVLFWITFNVLIIMRSTISNSKFYFYPETSNCHVHSELISQSRKSSEYVTRTSLMV